MAYMVYMVGTSKVPNRKTVYEKKNKQFVSTFYTEVL